MSKLQVIEHDFSDFMHLYDMKMSPASTNKEVITHKNNDTDALASQDKQMSLTLFFLVVTIILIAILVLLYLLNKKSNPTKQVIEKHQNSHGKS